MLEDASFSRTIDLTYQRLTEVSLSNPDPSLAGPPLEFGSSDPGPPTTSFWGRATTTVGGTMGGLLPVMEARAEATFENLVLIDGGEGFARTSATTHLEFRVEPIDPMAPLNIPVPLEFTTTGLASVTGDGVSGDTIIASISLTVDRLRENSFPFSETLSALARCDGTSYPMCSSSALETVLDSSIILAFLPLTDLGSVGQLAVGDTLPNRSTGPHSSGSYLAWIDPIVRVDPSFMVELNGELVPGSLLYGLTYSENVVIPEPRVALLIGLGLMLLAVRVRGHAI